MKDKQELMDIAYRAEREIGTAVRLLERGDVDELARSYVDNAGYAVSRILYLMKKDGIGNG